ncbi:NAD(P)/FAD-dependent oxidoreductase [Nakamurella silvestris]|nr:NAD(P)/FAD-dependent oxidoreductase [Nakamurella silvestris]
MGSSQVTNGSGRYDVVVAGGGHNGVVAAILAAQAGKSVLLLERADHLGGASVGERVFRGQAARLSRYSYLVSLFPDELVQRLGITLPLASRAVSSYTPTLREGVPSGLLVERRPTSVTEDSFRALTGGDTEWQAWQQLYGELSELAQVVAPALLGPLRRRSEVRRAVIDRAGGQIWEDLAERPISEMITRRFADDTVRGVVATDALIGTFTSLADESLLANRCFLYHLIGRGTGEWHVPVGGMGALADALTARARALGVEIRCGVQVDQVAESAKGVSIAGTGSGGGAVEVEAGSLLAAVAPVIVDGWLGRESPGAKPEGAQLKINMLLDRLPKLASGIDPVTVFDGTTHLEEGYEQLEAAYRAAAAGEVGEFLPAEVYCHSLSDPSILDGHRGHTLTLFGLHAPARLFAEDPAGAKARVAAAALASLQRHLAEPLEDCLSRDKDGWLCVDIASPLDVESSVGMPGGHIFHGDLTWPWLEDDEEAGTAAARQGVTVPGTSRILLAGSGSRRGGGVSGLGGLAAVSALLDEG